MRSRSWARCGAVRRPRARSRPATSSLLAARLGIGVGQAGFGPAASALLGATFPAERRATVLGVFQMGAPLGIVTGAVVGSLVSAHWGWRAAFLVVALPGLVLALLALRMGDYRNVPERSRGRAAAATLLRARSALGAMLGGALLLVIFSTLYTWLPTHLERAYGMPPARAGVLASTVVLAGALGTASAGLVADRLARRDVRWRMFVPAVAAVATTATLGTAFVAVPPGGTQMVLILLGGATATTAIGPAAAVVLDVVPPGVRATAVSIFAVVQNLMGLAVGPVLTGALADRWGLTTALASVAVLGLAAGFAFWWGSRSYGQDRVRVGLSLRRCRGPVVRKPLQGDQLHAEALEASDDPVQRGLVHDGTPQLGLRTEDHRAERVQRGEDVRADPSPDPERVLVAHCASRSCAPRAGPILAGAGMSWDRPAGTSPTVCGYSAEKFSPPVVTDVVSRPRLHPPVTARSAAPVTVVAATAGWGKTIFAASWLAGRGR